MSEETTRNMGGQAPAISALAAMTLVLVFPRRTFERLRERPHWLLPLAFVAGSVALSAVYAARGGFLTGVFEAQALRTGWDPATVESRFIALSVVGPLVAVPVVALLQTLFYKLAGWLFDGRARFRVAFSAVAYASIPTGIGALLFAALLPLTHSATLGANLSFLVDPLTRPGLWSLTRQIDLFAVWFFLLLGVAAEPIFGLPQRRARLAAAVFAVVHVAGMATFGIGEAESLADPYAGWDVYETPVAVIHHAPGEDGSVLAEIGSAVASARARAAELVGADAGGRIDCYVYPSVDTKLKVTDNGSVAHGVEWANAVHVAWAEGAEPAMTRALTKVAAGRTLGNVYNPLIGEGLAIYAGGVWDGEPVVRRAAELQAAGTLPPLEALVEPAAYGRYALELSEPAAGAFTAFLLDELGDTVYRELYSSAAGAVSVRSILEEAMDDSIEGIERRWTAYLEAAALERGAEPVIKP
jgi:hypothetical protein